MSESPQSVGWLRSIVATIGAWIIYGLIWIFGRTHRRETVRWLAGPVGGDVIGDAPYEAVATSEGLTVERRSRDGGLVPDFAALRGDDFDPSRIHPLMREFYEHRPTSRWTCGARRTFRPASASRCW